MKQLAKHILETLATVAAWPTLGLHALLRPVIGRQRACAWAIQRASRWPGVGGEYCRRAVLRAVLDAVGEEVVVSLGSLITKPSARLGDGVYVGAYCLLGDVRVGASTLIADQVCIPSGAAQHGIDDLDTPIRQQEGEFRTVHIGCDCWIGSGSIVLADVGDHSVVAAGSVVTRPVQAWKIVAGNPAREIGDRRERAASGDQGRPVDDADAEVLRAGEGAEGRGSEA